MSLRTALEAAASAVRTARSRLAAALPRSRSDDAVPPTLSPDEAIRRAHALGVAAAFGRDTDDRLEAVRDALDDAYDRSIVDLAYREGRGDAGGVDRSEVDRLEVDGAEELRTAALDGDAAPGTPETPHREGRPTPAGARSTATDLPTALARADLLEGGDELGALGFPAGLGEPSDGGGDD